jgi:hypothetical protein
MSPRTRSLATWTSKTALLRSNLMFKLSQSPTSTALSDWRMLRSLLRSVQPEKRYLYHHRCISCLFYPAPKCDLHLKLLCSSWRHQLHLSPFLLGTYLLSLRRHHKTTRTLSRILCHKACHTWTSWQCVPKDARVVKTLNNKVVIMRSGCLVRIHWV